MEDHKVLQSTIVPSRTLGVLFYGDEPIPCFCSFNALLLMVSNEKLLNDFEIFFSSACLERWKEKKSLSILSPRRNWWTRKEVKTTSIPFPRKAPVDGWRKKKTQNYSNLVWCKSKKRFHCNNNHDRRGAHRKNNLFQEFTHAGMLRYCFVVPFYILLDSSSFHSARGAKRTAPNKMCNLFTENFYQHFLFSSTF